MGHHILFPSAAAIILLILSLSTVTAADSVVLDVDGNPVEAGSQYYVLTSVSGSAGRGGLMSGPDLYDGICPFYVGQYKSWIEQGSPVNFYPADTSQRNITQGSDVNIAFRPKSRLRKPRGVAVGYYNWLNILRNYQWSYRKTG
ncbi:hypothetical protein SOVF_044540 [Spinacia oleracea]|nr:hypothetical protein SOVF_044540 [Spinacia oleracea]